MAQISINYLAVLAAALAQILIGMLWYSSYVFGKQWVAAMGWSKKEMQAAMKRMGPGYMLSIATALITAYVMAHAVDYMRATTFGSAVQLAFWIWLGFVATTSAMPYIWGGRNGRLYWIDMGFHLVNLIVMATILALWV